MWEHVDAPTLLRPIVHSGASTRHPNPVSKDPNDPKTGLWSIYHIGAVVYHGIWQQFYGSHGPEDSLRVAEKDPPPRKQHISPGPFGL